MVKLASQRLSAPNAGGRLQPVLVSGEAMGRISPGRISAPRIPTNAANVKYTPMPVPKIQEDVFTATLNAAADTSAVVANAAFKYQQRENEVYAKYAVMEFNQEMSRALNGFADDQGNFQPGYLQTERMEASGAYGGMKQSVEDKYSDILSKLEPGARQAAMMSMSSARDTALSKASVHRVKQLQAAEEVVQYERRKQFSKDISEDPSSIYRRDKFTGLTGKEKFHKEFSDPVVADNAWYTLITDTTKKVYMDNIDPNDPNAANEAAKAFFNGVAARELATSPSHLVALQANMMKYEQEAARSENAAYDLVKKRQKQQKAENWAIGEEALAQSRLSGELKTKAELSKLVEGGMLDPALAIVYKKDMYGKQEIASDQEALEDWASKLERGVPADYRRDVSLTAKDRKFLADLEADLKRPEFQNRYKRGSIEIGTWLRGSQWTQGLYKQQEEKQVNQARRELHARLSTGENYNDVMADMKLRYDTTVVVYKRLPPPRFSISTDKPTKPTDMQTLAAAGQALQKNRPSISSAEYKEQKELLRQYQLSIIDRDKKQADADTGSAK